MNVDHVAHVVRSTMCIQRIMYFNLGVTVLKKSVNICIWCVGPRNGEGIKIDFSSFKILGGGGGTLKLVSTYPSVL